MKRLTLTEPRDVRRAWLIWAVFALVICVVIIVTGDGRTIGAYREAAINWYEGKDLYAGGIRGFLYLPHAAILYLPIAKLPFAVGEVLWRLICIGSFAFGVWRLASLAGRESHVTLFPLMTVLSIPTAMESARYGQMNLPLAALMMLAVADLGERRWWRALCWMLLGLAVKPHMIVLVLLVGALYRPMMWRLPIGLISLFLLPFLTGSPDYSMRQYELFVHKLAVAVKPPKLYADLFGMLRSFGIEVAFSIQTAFRAAAALLTFGLCWIGFRRWGETRGAVLLLTLAAAYLMLFNPRTEINTYAVLGPTMAVFAAWEMLVDRRLIVAWALIVMVLLVAGSYEIAIRIRPVRPIWLSPIVCVIVVGYVLSRVLAVRRV